MNALLAKHCPKDADLDEWVKRWEAAASLLQPLANTLKDLKAGLGQVKADDFDCPNHYTKLVAEQVQRQMIDKILAMFPSTVER